MAMIRADAMKAVCVADSLAAKAPPKNWMARVWVTAMKPRWRAVTIWGLARRRERRKEGARAGVEDALWWVGAGSSASPGFPREDSRIRGRKGEVIVEFLRK